MHARCEHVGLALRGAGVGEVGGRPVARVEAVVRVVHAHREDAGVVRRVGKLVRRCTIVAGRGDDHHPVHPGDLGRVGQRVDGVRLLRERAEREVQHLDVHAVVVAVLHDPVDAGDDLRHVGRTVGRADLDVDDPRVGRDADELGRVTQVAGVTAGDDPGHVRAVAVRVDRLGQAVPGSRGTGRGR